MLLCLTARVSRHLRLFLCFTLQASGMVSPHCGLPRLVMALSKVRTCWMHKVQPKLLEDLQDITSHHDNKLVITMLGNIMTEISCCVGAG